MALPDAAYYHYKYLRIHGQLCRFERPRRFSEKIFHRMRYPSPLFSQLADKVEVRRYIAGTVGTQFLVPAHLVAEHVTPETFDALPESFVMKANHSFSQLRIVQDKRDEDPVELARLANGWMTSQFSARMREKHYGFIRPRVIFEQALLTNGRPPADFKFNVFNPGAGQKPYIFIQHMQGRFEYLTQDLYEEDWRPAPFRLLNQKTSGRPAPRPVQLDEMLQIARKLAEPLGYMRVDLYLHQGRIYVGELTLTPGAGRYIFDPKGWDEILGAKFGWPEPLASRGLPSGNGSTTEAAPRVAAP
ncbi:ATP-grasp fold amidoligase family protein [Frateuria hangzhouensis]|uniref:ATP-grasp fold amidoligase family protein n=1 Tax=Frateuria hangzhouensis TaxID=2995589 RepID=UPI002260DD63|nr:ATP-grasp fold amidoligase family protein [Frateuria sp. STR12]MCX7513948.1 ATP-grasp fold amidoligase family protein [Frateuria sp. STR12]